MYSLPIQWFSKIKNRSADNRNSNQTTETPRGINTSTNMNFFTSADQIMNMPISEKERNHPSRKRIAYHVFLSHFCAKVSSLSDREKKDTFRQLGIWRRPVYEGYDSDDDSIMSVPKLATGDLMRAAGRVWRDHTGLDLKEAWKNRASALNLLPEMDGTFREIPEALEDPHTLEENTMRALSLDWQNLALLFKQAVFSGMNRLMGDSRASYKFGNERVVVSTQSYRKFYMNYLLKLTLFGSPLYRYELNPHEVPYRSSKQTILHIYSHRRFCELFTYGGLNAGTIIKDGLKYMICAKANLRRGRRNIIGYVLDEDPNQFHVEVEGEENYVLVDKATYNYDQGRFEYPCRVEAGTYQLTQIWPIRMKLNSTGQSSFLISYCVQQASDDDMLTLD